MSNETYADLASLKDWLAIEDARDDFKLSTALIAASRFIDNYTHRRFYIDTEEQSYYAAATTGNTVWFPDLSDLPVSVAVDSDYSLSFATTVTSADYTLKPYQAPYRSLTVRGITLVPTDVVRITGLFGFPTVPVEIEQATLMLASRYFKRALTPEGIAGFGDMGVVRIAMRDSDVEALISPYKIHGWA